MALIVLNNETVQTRLLQNFAHNLEEKTGSTVRIGKVNFSFFNKLSLEDVFISDTHNDTLFYVKKLKTNIEGINLSSSNVRLKNLELEDPYLKIISYENGSMNLFTFIDALEGKNNQDTTQSTSSYFFSSATTSVKNGRFVYYDSDRVDIPYGMNYDDIDFYNINATVTKLRTAGSALKMAVDSLKCEEKSGLQVLESVAALTIDKGLLRLDSVHIALPKSELNADYLNFSYIPGTRAWVNFVRAVTIDYMVKESKINLGEIALFNDNLRGYNQTITASGHITGTVQNMRCENMLAKVYDNTVLSTNLSMNGLPNIDETFFDANILQLKTSLDDLEKIKIPNYDEEYLSFPKVIKKLGAFTYKGKYTGFISDFVFYGQFFSSYGNVKTDISLRPTTRTNQLEVSGKIITNDFEIGELIENKMVGKVSLNMDVVNAMANENYTSYAKLKGTINKLELNKYPYETIKIDAYLADKVFDGKLSMNDEHVAFDFQGSFDLHEEIPKTNFNLNVKHAQLAPLNLNMFSKDTLAQVAFKVKSQLDGGSIDNATGLVNVFDLKYSNSKGSITTDTISLQSSLERAVRTLDVKSQFIDANLKGNFKISQLSTLPKRLASAYINVGYFNIADSIPKENGELSIHFKNAIPLLDLLTDGYKISNNAKLTAHYNMGIPNEVKLHFDAKLLKYGDRALHNIQLDSEGDKQLQTHLNIDRVDFTEDFNLIGLSVGSTLRDNVMSTTLNWGNAKSLDYSGTLSLKSVFRELENQQFSVTNTFAPTTFSLDGEDWKMNHAEILLDSTDVQITNFKITNEEEYLELDGHWSPDKDDLINANLHALEIGHLWRILGQKDITLSGKMSGYAQYKSVGNSHALASNLQIPNVTVENQRLGSLTINSEWDQSKAALNTKASLVNGKQKIFSLNGLYGLENSSLAYTVNFDEFDLLLVKDFTKAYLTNLEGNIDGQLSIGGNIKKPSLNGALSIDIPDITVAETGVSYHLQETLKIQNSRIAFKDFQLLDANNKAATINGEIATGIGENADVNLNITAKNFSILHDSYQPLAYGDARVSANLDVTGNFERIKIRGDVATDNYSKIIVPFDSASEVGDNDFITFINPADSIKYRENNDILFIPTGAKSPVLFNVDFTINPTSEIQVLFESNSGSILKSRGTADLHISRNKLGKQNITGQYTVAQGTFFYSLENIVNKKFILQEGGTIRWDGAPEKAYIDLDAIYQVKASVTPLLYQKGSNTVQGQTTVLCKTHISGQLEDPKLTFQIDFPNLDSTTEGNVKAALQTTDMTKQVLSLLVFNRFTTPEYTPNISTNNSDALSVTTSELLSSQLSNILSQLSEDVNIGFIYRPGDDLTKEELGVAISTELLQNRVVISGNLGFSSQDNTSRFNDFIGDVDFDIKLNKRGNLRLRAFSHARDNLYYYENKRNIQGAGIIYNEQFDTFKELIQHYKEKLRWGKKKDKN